MDLLDELLNRHETRYHGDDYLFSFPSVPLHQRATLPEVPAIYFAFGGLDVLYIGMSMNLRSRWRSHHRLPDLLAHRDAWLHYLPVDEGYTLTELRALETWCIRHFQPRYNSAPINNPWRQRFTVVYRALRETERAYFELRRKTAA